MNDCIGIVKLEKLNYKNEGFLNKETIASLPFAGQYKIIDFTLSNFVNSGIKNISIFSGNRYREVNDHIGPGKGWGGNIEKFKLSFYYPEDINRNVFHLKGDINNFYKNLSHLKNAKENYVLISKTKMICNLDLEKPFRYHQNSNSDVTVIYKKVKNIEKYKGLEVLDISPDNNVKSISKNNEEYEFKENIDLSMEMYFMKKEVLIEMIEETVDCGKESCLKEAFINNSEKYNISSYEYKGYLACAHTLENFYYSNMEIINRNNYDELFNNERQVLTRVKESTSTLYGRNSEVKNSILASGCNIEGKIDNSIVFHGTKISKDSNLSNSLVGKKYVLTETLKLDVID